MKKPVYLFFSLMLALGACNSNSEKAANYEREAPAESKSVSNDVTANPYGNPNGRRVKA